MASEQLNRMTPADWRKARSKLLAMSLKAQDHVAASELDGASAPTDK